MSAHYNFLTKLFYFCLEIISTRIDMYTCTGTPGLQWIDFSSTIFLLHLPFPTRVLLWILCLNTSLWRSTMNQFNLLAITFHIKTIFKYIVAVTFSYTSSYIIITAILYLKERTWFIFAQLPDRSHKD